MTAGLVLATLMTSAAVSMAGLIGFVGLIIPHVVRGLIGPDHRRLIPVTFVSGGVFLAVCDAIARTILAMEVPVGVITAMIGGPFFLLVLYKRRKQGWVE
jgi:iron complex transport system permease protein